MEEQRSAEFRWLLDEWFSLPRRSRCPPTPARDGACPCTRTRSGGHQSITDTAARTERARRTAVAFPLFPTSVEPPPFNNEAHVPDTRRRRPTLPGPAGGGPQGVASQRVDHPRGGSRPDRGVVERSAAVGCAPSLGSSVARPQWWPVSFHRVHDCHIHAARARPFLRHVRHGPGSPRGFPVVVDF